MALEKEATLHSKEDVSRVQNPATGNPSANPNRQSPTSRASAARAVASGGAIASAISELEHKEDRSGHIAELQRVLQTDSSRHQRTLAALDKKHAKGEALLQSEVLSMLEKRGEDASASAVTNEVQRRRQAWESELLQFHSERQQGCVEERDGGSVMMRGRVAAWVCEVLLMHAAQLPLRKLLLLRMTRRHLWRVREGEARGRSRSVLPLRRQAAVSKFLLLL